MDTRASLLCVLLNLPTTDSDPLPPVHFSPFCYDQSLSASRDFFLFFFPAGVPSQPSQYFLLESIFILQAHSDQLESL